jgi:hypothetical protein
MKGLSDGDRFLFDGDDHGKARRFDRVERDRRVRRSSDGEARSSQRTSAFAVAV